jgi:hypothetical protein
VTGDCARVLRVPGTFNHKTTPPRPVKLLGTMRETDYAFSTALAFLPAIVPIRVATPGLAGIDWSLFPKKFGPPVESLAEGIDLHELPPLDVKPLFKECAFIREAMRTGGACYSQPMWNMGTLAATWLDDGLHIAHLMGNKHSGYTHESTETLYERKIAERKNGNIGWPSCAAIQAAGCTSCAACTHRDKGKSPLNFTVPSAPPAPPPPPLEPGEPSFVDPYAEFVGPPFPMDVLPPTLAKFVDAEHRAMGADLSALAMAALTTAAGAMHAETQVRAGEGWWEKPIIWTALVGIPSTLKSPIIAKTTKPLSNIDHEQHKRWKQEYEQWRQTQKQ